MSASPPRLALRLLGRTLAHDPARAAILGDLQEDFVRTLLTRGPAAARRWYWREALLLATGRFLRGSHAASRSRGDARASAGMRGVLQDAGYALRVLRRAPAFALFTAAMIALGVGAATSVFSVLRPLVLAPLPFAEPDQLVWIENRGEPGDNSLAAITSRALNLRDFRERSRSFAILSGYDAFSDNATYTLTGVGEPERLVGVGVAPNFLAVLGVEPLYGRRFTAEEEARGGPPAVILTHGFWMRRFAGDPEVVGRSITLNDGARTVVGVLPPSFDFSSVFTPGQRVDFLSPFRLPSTATSDFQGNVLFMIGRLREGRTHESAQAELDALMATLQQEDPRRWGLGAVVTPLAEHVAGPFRSALFLLAAAAGTLLLIVCVNVSNLVLSRSPGRAREVAVRKAFGAPRARLVRQLLMETLWVSLLGAALGSVLAWGVTRLVARAAGIRIPLLGEVRVDGSALLFASALAIVTGFVVGVLPALQVAEGGEASVLRSAARGSSASRGARRLREALVFAQVTLACVLLVFSGLLVRSFRSVLAVDLGFEPSNAVAWQLATTRSFDVLGERADFFAGLAERVARVPGVEQAGLIDGLPLGRNRSWGFSLPGVPEEEDTDDQLFPHIVDHGYLDAMRIDVLAGRNISRGDREDAPRVILMNESGARRVFGDANPIGQRIRIWTPQDWEVVGVVEDVRNVSPEMGAGIQVYFPMAQMPDYSNPDLVVRSTLTPEQIAAAVSAVLREIDPSLPTREFWTLEATVERAVSARRFTLAVLGAFGAAALLLAGLGIYGVLAQAVAERRSEIGIRLALGASASGILVSTLAHTLQLTASGIAVGALIALAGSRLIGSLLFGVSAADPVTFLGMAAVLLLVAGVAAVLPALRAARTPAVGALRTD